jgi:hypothetical protein
MYVRCAHCGYDNSPEYRFCGMCGGSLAHPVTETRPPARDVAPPPAPPPAPAIAPVSAPAPASGPVSGNGERVHGPSFLGLSEDPKVEFNYLYEEEPTRSHAGLIAVLLLLIGAGGFLGWQWRHHGFRFNRLSAGSSVGQPGSPAASGAPPQSQETQAEKPVSGVGDVSPATSGQKTEADSSGKSAEVPSPTGQNAGASPQESAAPPEKPKEKAEAPPPKVPARSPSTKRASVGTKSATVEPAAMITSPDADLELTGERYLYGNGLPQNCTRAESSLRTAATHGNPKAQTVLGTMYATGHCVGRDLPTAYRWFARALHKDPQNSRISADLQVLWRQMTPQEKQLATASGQ